MGLFENVRRSREVEVDNMLREVAAHDAFLSPIAIYIDEFNLYSNRLVGLINGREETAWFFKDYNMVQSAKASLNTQFAQVVFVTAMNTKVTQTVISTATNLAIVNDVNRILFCSGMFSYAPANEYADNLCREIQEAFNQFKQRRDEPTSSAALSPADEIKKYKDLLDSGAITQEEFDIKKKELLGL